MADDNRSQPVLIEAFEDEIVRKPSSQRNRGTSSSPTDRSTDGGTVAQAADAGGGHPRFHRDGVAELSEGGESSSDEDSDISDESSESSEEEEEDDDDDDRKMSAQMGGGSSRAVKGQLVASAAASAQASCLDRGHITSASSALLGTAASTGGGVANHGQEATTTRTTGMSTSYRNRGVVDHTYRDFSRLNGGQRAGDTIQKEQQQQGSSTGGSSIQNQSFPAKLHEILDTEQYMGYISWMPHGRAFRVLIPKRFEAKVCPRYFKHQRFSTFLRHLNNWGFKHITQGHDRNCYYHEAFLFGHPHLVKYFPRPRNRQKLAPDPPNEPDFYRINDICPLPRLPTGKHVPPPPKGGSMRGTEDGTTNSSPHVNFGAAAAFAQQHRPEERSSYHAAAAPNVDLQHEVGQKRPHDCLHQGRDGLAMSAAVAERQRQPTLEEMRSLFTMGSLSMAESLMNRQHEHRRQQQQQQLQAAISQAYSLPSQYDYVTKTEISRMAAMSEGDMVVAAIAASLNQQDDAAAAVAAAAAAQQQPLDQVGFPAGDVYSIPPGSNLPYHPFG